MLVFILRLWLKKLRGIDKYKNDKKYNKHIQDNTTNATQDQIESKR